MERNKLGVAAAALACAAGAALLAARLGQAPTPSAAPGPELAPLSSTIVTPLADGSRYTNDELARRLQDETGRMGITGIAKPEEEPSGGGSFLGERLGQPGTRAQAESYIRQLAQMRRPLERDKDKTVKLPGGTAGLLGAPPRGRPLDVEAATDSARPRKVEIE